ncbi:MAG: serine/threonine protein kinase [Actinomycetota bacterium]|nr:serine/threonine protein kinase [Actinomycetota bacterium]
MVTRPVPEQRLGDRYVLREQVGRGGFGIVWRAHDNLLQRDVAVKAIEFPPILDDAEQAVIRTKVLREARAAARLNHPGLVTVFDVIEEDGRPLIVMELVRAPTLADLVARHGPLAESRAAAIALDVLNALGAAHTQGIIHRDVKPANVMVSESGHVQLGDFGIAAVIDDPKLTNSGNLAGSPSFMAPEQAENRPPTAATDLWGLGATLYFAVEGQPPFVEPGAIATLTSVVNAPHRPLVRAKALGPLIDALLAKRPAERPSAAEVKLRLSEVVAGATPDAPGDSTSTAEFDLRADWTPLPVSTAESAPRPEAATATPEATTATPEAATAPVAAPGLDSAAAAPAAGAGTRDRPTTDPIAPPVADRPAAVHPAPRAAPSRRRRRDGSRARLAVPLVLGMVVLAAVLLSALLVRGRSDPSPKAAIDAPVTTSAAGRPAPTGAPKAPANVATNVPTDWVGYQDPATGFAIAHPPSWTVSTDGTLTDFRDPSSGAYLRVDHREPPGPSPEGAWYEFEPTFSARNAGYKRLQITPTTYEGYRAAVWEYTYTGGGADLRAVDLGFVTANHGFALNFQSTASEWDRLQPVFAAFKASFKAPSA